MSIKLFGREPAAVLALVAALVKLASAFWWHATVVQQAQVNTVAACIVAVAVACIVHDGYGAAILGLLQAAMAAAVGFGLHWSAGNQALVMATATAFLAMWTRGQVVAPVAAAALPSAKRPVQST